MRRGMKGREERWREKIARQGAGHGEKEVERRNEVRKIKEGREERRHRNERDGVGEDRKGRALDGEDRE